VTTHLPPAQPPTGRNPLLLDLGGVDVLSAAGLGELVTLHRRVRASGGNLVLCNVGDRAYEVLELSRLTDVLDVRRRHPGCTPTPFRPTRP
jgi:anti-anti-sigma factor